MDSNFLLRNPALSTISEPIFHLEQIAKSSLQAGGKILIITSSEGFANALDFTRQLLRTEKYDITSDQQDLIKDLPYGMKVINNLSTGYPIIILGLNPILYISQTNQSNDNLCSLAQEMLSVTQHNDLILCCGPETKCEAFYICATAARLKGTTFITISNESDNPLKDLSQLYLQIPCDSTLECIFYINEILSSTADFIQK